MGAEAAGMSGSQAPTDLVSQAEAVAQPARARGQRGFVRRSLIGVLSTLLSSGLILFAWWAFLEYFDVDPYIGKGPSDVWHYLFSGPAAGEHRTFVLDSSWLSLRDAAIGLALGTAAAVAAAMLFNASRVAERSLMPIAMVLRSVPVFAMTPVIAVTFGRNLKAVAVVASIVTFFPTLVNVTLALRGAPKEAMDLLRAYGGSRGATMRKVQLPSALPALFASLRVAAPLAIVGALLAEWLASGEGMGHDIIVTSSTSEFSAMWALVVLATLYSIILYKVIGAIEGRMLARYAPSYGH